MTKIKVMSVFGVRPEAVKMAPVIKELEKYPEAIESYVTVTGQHKEMLHQILDMFAITTDYDLDIMKQKQTLIDIFERSMRGLDKTYKEVDPDIVLVHGDTLTSFVAALTAFYNKIKVGHVEAGLRTYQKYFPYPEEINRQLTGVLADMHFAPTQTAKENLLKENIKQEKIYVTGNTVIDALDFTVEKDYKYTNQKLAENPWQDKRVILMEVHRRENWGQPIREICEAVRDIVLKYKDSFLVFPVHLNPIVKDVVYDVFEGVDRVLLLGPLDTNDFHNIMAEAEFLVSDSGGVQEEAPALGTPVLVTRDVTERPEAVNAGTVEIVGTKYQSVYNSVKELLTNKEKLNKMSMTINPYGDGLASRRIVLSIMNEFGLINQQIEEWNYTNVKE
ncbi:MAG: non-hydrolyzing UDP-N-acetylglucosamine 2-epimerase [Clostridia bacterium]